MWKGMITRTKVKWRIPQPFTQNLNSGYQYRFLLSINLYQFSDNFQGTGSTLCIFYTNFLTISKAKVATHNNLLEKSGSHTNSRWENDSYEDNASISHYKKSHQTTNNVLLEDVKRVDVSSTHSLDIFNDVEPKDIKGLN